MTDAMSALPAGWRNRRDGRRRAIALRRWRRHVGTAIRSCPIRANASRMVPSVSPINRGKPSTGPQICHSATMSSVSVDANAAATRTRGVFERDRDKRRRFTRGVEPDGDAAIGGDQQVHGHPPGGECAAQDHPFAMQIDNAQAFVRRGIGGPKTRWQ